MERREGPTPAGGANSVAVFMDDSGQVVDEDKATQVVITEYTTSGERLRETWAHIIRQPSAPRKNGP